MNKKTSETTEKDIEAALETKPKIYALFYASWCPHSQRFLPIFEEYEETNPNECIKVMIDFKANLCDKYAIEYYPTVLMLKKGKVQKRIDATPGVGLTKDQLTKLTSTR